MNNDNANVIVCGHIINNTIIIRRESHEKKVINTLVSISWLPEFQKTGFDIEMCIFSGNQKICSLRLLNPIAYFLAMETRVLSPSFQDFLSYYDRIIDDITTYYYILFIQFLLLNPHTYAQISRSDTYALAGSLAGSIFNTYKEIDSPKITHVLTLF